MIKALFLPIALLFVSLPVFAEPLMNRKVNNVFLYDLFKNEGVPTDALLRTFDFLDTYAGKDIVVAKKIRPAGKAAKVVNAPIKVQGQFAAIVDFSRPSTEKRLFLLNLKTGSVEKFYAAHGRNSGMLNATTFSNINMSKMSTLGILIAGDTYYGGHGRSMNLYGAEATDNLAAQRDIVMHGASYVSEEFIAAHGRLGVSWGCPTVEKSALPRLIEALSNGSVIYHFHPRLAEYALKSPQKQEFTDMPGYGDPIIDLPGEEEDIQRRR